MMINKEICSDICTRNDSLHRDINGFPTPQNGLALRRSKGLDGGGGAQKGGNPPS